MKKKTKQILALSAVVLLAGLYLATLVFAIIDIPGSAQLFRASLFATVTVPLLMWIYIWLYGAITKKETIADIFPENNKKEDSAEK